MNVLSFEQMKEKYPNEWVLIGNPEIVATKVLKGIVIFHSKDKREIAYRQINWREQFDAATTIFTGQLPKNRRFWL
jgi:hypothetical protein